MFALYAMLLTAAHRIDARLDRSERGDLLAFVALGVMVIIVALALIAPFRDGMKEILSNLLDRVKNAT